MNYTCSNGYEIEIKRLCPYYLDFLDEVLPYIDLPKRKIRLISGDVIEVDYKFPDEEPDELDEDYDLYYLYLSTVQRNDAIRQDRDILREDFLLLQCINVISGPTSYEDKEWKEELRASIGFEVPTDPYKQKLYHLKYCVIQADEKEHILNYCLYKEVSMAQISKAMDTFQD